MSKYKTAVYIGRFAPFHNGHLSVIKKASEIADEVLILVGSANASRSIRTPWNYAERSVMIDNGLDGLRLNYTRQPLDDYTYNDNQWIQQVQEIVGNNSKEVVLVGFDKDHTSSYLSMFPQWSFEPAEQFPEFGTAYHATDIRDLFFQGKFHFIESAVPSKVFESLTAFTNLNTYQELVDEYGFIQKYKKQWESAPYPVTFVTTDAVIIQSGHILMVRRKAYPGKGLYALPGGFVNQDENVFDSCIREVKEETRLKVPEPVLRGSVFASQVFDNPERSSRGRTITHAFGFQLHGKGLPKVKGADDADKAMWVPLSEFENPKFETKIYEDHLHIVNNILRRS